MNVSVLAGTVAKLEQLQMHYYFPEISENMEYIYCKEELQLKKIQKHNSAYMYFLRVAQKRKRYSIMLSFWVL